VRTRWWWWWWSWHQDRQARSSAVRGVCVSMRVTGCRTRASLSLGRARLDILSSSSRCSADDARLDRQHCLSVCIGLLRGDECDSRSFASRVEDARHLNTIVRRAQRRLKGHAARSVHTPFSHRQVCLTPGARELGFAVEGRDTSVQANATHRGRRRVELTRKSKVA